MLCHRIIAMLVLLADNNSVCYILFALLICPGSEGTKLIVYKF